MKKILLILVSMLFVSGAFADTYVNGYYRSDGTYVKPHYRSSPNSSYNDNYSVKGNRNPHTGEQGTRKRSLDGRYPYSRYKLYSR